MLWTKWARNKPEKNRNGRTQPFLRSAERLCSQQSVRFGLLLGVLLNLIGCLCVATEAHGDTQEHSLWNAFFVLCFIFIFLHLLAKKKHVFLYETWRCSRYIYVLSICREVTDAPLWDYAVMVQNRTSHTVAYKCHTSKQNILKHLQAWEIHR